MTRAILIMIFICNFAGVFSQTNDAELLSQITEIIIDNGKLIKNQSFEIQINNREGEEFSKISIFYTKDNKVSKIVAYIKDNTGNIIRKIKKSDIIEKSAIPDGSFYTDYFVKEFTLRHSTYPYTIFYSFQEECEQFIHLDDWTPVIAYKIPTIKAELKISIPKDYEIKFLQNSIENPKINDIENRKIYLWESSYNKCFNPEIYSSADDMKIPWVIIVPKQFNYEKQGSFESWISYGNWNLELLNGMDDLPEIEKNKINNLIKDIKDKKEQIKILYQHLQDETRYVNISIKTGGLKPYPASYVAKNKFGDCKALSNYFKSVLNVIGVQSFYTTVNAGEDIEKIYTDFPSHQSNHIILFIPFENDTIWLDCTNDGPFNYLGTFTQNREAFVIEKDKSHLVKTPALSIDEVLESRVVKIDQKPDGSVLSSFCNIYKGEMFKEIYPFAESINEVDKTRIVRKYFVEANLELLDYFFIKRDRDDPRIILEINARADKVFQKQGRETLVKMLPFKLPKFEKPKDRKLPVHLDFPINKLDTIQYSFSDALSIGELPKDKDISSKYGTYKLRIIKNNNIVEVVKQLILYAGIYSIEEYLDFYKFILTVSEIENNSFIVLNSNK
jgi:hypothetical protein